MRGDLSKWREQCKVSSALNPKCDKRKVNGLRQRVTRLYLKPETQTEGGILKNYLKVVEAALALGDVDGMAAMEESEMHKLIDLVSEEIDVWPPDFCHRLLKRKAHHLMVGRKWSELVAILNPWAEKVKFDPKNPCMAALLEDEEVMANTCAHVLLVDGVAPLVRQGQASVPDLQGLCGECVTVFSQVDFAELPNGATQVLAAAVSVWKALLALLATQYTPEQQAS